MAATEPKTYFPNLDALRFIAATSVMIAHTAFYFKPAATQIFWIHTYKHYIELGVLGVNFFFVLSGFLITYLMLQEEKLTGGFSAGKYYMRRVLRIWPVFYMVLFIAFIGTPIAAHLLHYSYSEMADPVWYVCFLNNFYDLIHPHLNDSILPSLWTVATEEQFYIFFPLMMLLPRRYKITWPLLVIMVSLLFRVWDIHNHRALYRHILAVMGDFGVGGLLAFFIFYKPQKIFNVLVNMPKWAIGSIYLSIGIVLVCYSTLFQIPSMIVFERLIMATLFAAVIFEQVFCINSLFKVGKWGWVNYGGKISYGIYCYQYFALIPVYYLLEYLHIYDRRIGFLFLHPLLSIIGAYVLAAISYRFYETPFLKLKKVFYPKQ